MICATAFADLLPARSHPCLTGAGRRRRDPRSARHARTARSEAPRAASIGDQQREEQGGEDRHRTRSQPGGGGGGRRARAHRCWTGRGNGRHACAAAVSAAGVDGRPRLRAAFTTPRSLAGKASGSPRPRIAMTSTVQGPNPGSLASRRRAPFGSASGPRSSAPDASAVTRVVRVVRRDRGSARVDGSSSASAAGSGKRCVRPPSGSSTASPWAVTRRAAWVRAAAVDTCWPSTARTASSAGSTVRGTRRPGAAATSGARCGSRPRCSSMTAGSASRSSSRRQRAIAVSRSRSSSRSRRHATWSGRGASATMPEPCGSRRVRRYAPARHSSTPGTAVAARCPNRLSGHSGGRNSRRSVTALGAGGRPAGPSAGIAAPGIGGRLNRHRGAPGAAAT